MTLVRSRRLPTTLVAFVARSRRLRAGEIRSPTGLLNQKKVPLNSLFLYRERPQKPRINGNRYQRN